MAVLLFFSCFLLVKGGQLKQPLVAEIKKYSGSGRQIEIVVLLFSIVSTDQQVHFFLGHHFQLNEKISNTRFPQNVVF